MAEIDWQKVGNLIDQLYQSTDELEEMFPGRKFTLDGHLVGSIGEVLASFMFDLVLNPASTIAHDAKTSGGKQVEIKLTQGRSVAIRHEPEHLLVLCRPKGTAVSVIYNGPGTPAWNAAGKMQRNGQRSVSLNKLSAIDADIQPEDRLPLKRESPL